MIPAEDLEKLVTAQKEILREIKSLSNSLKSFDGAPQYITAVEFMKAIRISRTKFDQLVSAGKIRIIKKRRKIYVSSGEIHRYFTDTTIL